MAKMRTIKQLVAYQREKDPKTAVSEWWVRGMVKSGKLKHHRVGTKYLIDLEYFEEFLENPPQEEIHELPQYGGIRKIY